jgi:hypothetical protein
MKRLFFAALAVAASATFTGAQAQTVATQDVTLSATVPSYCTIGGSNTPTALTGSITPSNGRVTAAQAFTITGSPGTVICNANVVVDLRSLNAGLTTAGAGGGSFVNVIHYDATAQLNDGTSTVTGTIDTSAATANTYYAAGTSSATSAGAFSAGTLTISVAAQATAPSYLVPGTYGDTLTVRLTPQ